MCIVGQSDAIDPIRDASSTEMRAPLQSGSTPLAVALTLPPEDDEVAIEAQVDAEVLQKGPACQTGPWPSS